MIQVSEFFLPNGQEFTNKTTLPPEFQQLFSGTTLILTIFFSGFCEPNIGRRQFDLCYQITADSALKSMFRLDISNFEDCPIEGAYSFTYSRGHGLCEYPKSSLSQCSDKSKLVFRYQVPTIPFKSHFYLKL